MSVFFNITYTTHYRYAQPVLLGEHRVLATDMRVTPTPVDIRLIQDAYSNSVALVQPQSPAVELKVVCSFSVEHTGTRALDFPLSPQAQTFPLLRRPQRRAAGLGAPVLRVDGETGSRQLRVDMTQFIRHSMRSACWPRT